MTVYYLAGTVVTPIVEQFTSFLPDLFAAAVFVSLAYLVIGSVTEAARKGFERKYGEPVLVDFLTDVTFGAMWFAAALMALAILGFDDIAASMGTASGFVALGIAFALKDMIADTVAGVRLLQDEDFNPGDEVKAADVEGEVVEIDLRKTRIDLESGDRVVASNKDVEKKWTKLNGE